MGNDALLKLLSHFGYDMKHTHEKHPPQNRSVAQSALSQDDQLALELGIPRTLRTEFNFLKFPFFDLTKDKKRTKIEIHEKVPTPQGDYEMLWKVTRGAESDFPGAFEKRLHRAVEQIINEMPKPVSNPICVGNITDLAKKMGIDKDAGKNFLDISRSLRNILKATIDAKGTFQVKEGKVKRFVDRSFHLYDQLVMKGETLPDGTTAGSIYLWLGDWYLQNINQNYVVPLDWPYYNHLAGSVTKRMYEYFSIQFFVALEKEHEHVDVWYSKLCEYFPINRYIRLWEARKQLKEAHTAHLASGYFAEVEWLESSAKDDWQIRYWIGARAREEYARNRAEVRHIGESAKPIPMPERRRQRQLPSATGNNAHAEAQNGPLARVLVESWGMTSSTAQSLIKSHTEERIREVLEWAAWAKDKKPALIQKNPAGWIRKCLIENWKKPAGYVSGEDLSRQKRERDEREAAQRALIDAQRSEEEWQIWNSMTPKQKVVGDLWTWVAKYKREHNGSEPSKEEYERKEIELIDTLPSHTEKQQQLFGYLKYPNHM